MIGRCCRVGESPSLKDCVELRLARADFDHGFIRRASRGRSDDARRDAPEKHPKRKVERPTNQAHLISHEKILFLPSFSEIAHLGARENHSLTQSKQTYVFRMEECFQYASSEAAYRINAAKRGIERC
jgi:hypothetical protein